MKVLIIDDEAEILDIAQVILRHKGYEAQTSLSGLQGLALAKQEKPDLILLDIMMPDISGWEVLRLLQEDPGTRDIPVMMLTALAQDQEILRGLEGGAVEYLIKPFDLIGLMGHVEWALKGSTPEIREQHRRTLIEKRRLVA